MPDALDVLAARGFVADVSDEEGLRAALADGPLTYYVGFDPTAESLHVGNLVGMMAMAWLQQAGHRPIALSGGATGRIGDPSFADAERVLLDDAEVERNLAGIRAQLGIVLDLAPPGTDDPARGLLLDNIAWFADFGVLEFLRDVGKHVSVNQLVARENVRRRLEDREQGISFTEFSYGLLQGYDYAHLHAAHGCRLQLGGSDQWGNILGGLDLTRRIHGAKVFALSWPLIEGSDGRKFSKSAGNAPWLDPAMTSPFAYYQWWVNTDDRDVRRFLRLFTFLDLEKIEEVVAAHEEDPAARGGQRRLAAEATRIVHGEDGLARAEAATAALFGGSVTRLDDATLAMAFEQAPTIERPRADLQDGVGLLDLLREAGLATSNGEARRLVLQGGVRVNDEPVDDPTRRIVEEDLATATTVVLRVGRRRQALVRFV